MRKSPFPLAFIISLVIISCFCSCAKRNLETKAFKVPLRTEVYATHWCLYCKMELEYLDSKNVKYSVYWVDEDEEKDKEMHKRCDSGAIPTTVITDKSGKEHCVIGFKKDELSALLGLK